MKLFADISIYPPKISGLGLRKLPENASMGEKLYSIYYEAIEQNHLIILYLLRSGLCWNHYLANELIVSIPVFKE